MYIEWDNFIQHFIIDRVERFGGVRKLAKQYNLDPSIVSKMINGKLVPSEKTFIKWFPDMKHIQVRKVIDI